MNTFRFKTNINCGGCITAVTPFLGSVQGVKDWNVDTANSDKILTVTVDGLRAEEIKAVVEKAGFTIEQL